MPGTPSPNGALHAAKRQQDLARVEKQQPLFRPILTSLSEGLSTVKAIARAIGSREPAVGTQLNSLCRKGYATSNSRGGGKPTFAITSEGEIRLQLHQTLLPQETQSSAHEAVDL